ncbi:MAG: hypothetical protein FJY98_03885 [Candidatus Liptonbacteria bacterium]|nr:hypothetical protein [Candidatus Liptonbacteria bacterium]
MARRIRMSDGTFSTSDEVGQDIPAMAIVEVENHAPRAPKRVPFLVAVAGDFLTGSEWLEKGSPPGTVVTKLFSALSERPASYSPSA